MSFVTEEEWNTAFEAAEDVILFLRDIGDLNLKDLSARDLARQVATAVIRSQHASDDIAGMSEVNVEQV